MEMETKTGLYISLDWIWLKIIKSSCTEIKRRITKLWKLMYSFSVIQWFCGNDLLD